jgi:hypothetical protein
MKKWIKKMEGVRGLVFIAALALTTVFANAAAYGAAPAAARMYFAPLARLSGAPGGARLAVCVSVLVAAAIAGCAIWALRRENLRLRARG